MPPLGWAESVLDLESAALLETSSYHLLTFTKLNDNMNEQSTIPLSDIVKKHAKIAYEQDTTGYQNFDAFLEHLVKPESSAALPIKEDLSHPLSHYYISSSHNSESIGALEYTIS